MSKKVNIKTLAADLGVSVSTVSKSLKNSLEISKETKERVWAYAQKMNYKPNSLALSLRNKKTMTIGIIVPELVHHFFSRVISGVEQVANHNAYHLMIALSNDRLDKEKQDVEMFANGRVDGIIVSVAKESFEKNDFSHFEDLVNRNFPIVFFDRVPTSIRALKVIIDDIFGGYQATKHLIDQGAKTLGILTTPPHITVGVDRQKGFLKALRTSQLPIYNQLQISINEKYPIVKQVEKIFSQGILPDGIFAVNENYAAIALEIALEKGIKVPEELKIIGFTDGLISKTTRPRLSTVAQHGFAMGTSAAEMLLSYIENKNMLEFDRISLIETNIVQRESTEKKRNNYPVVYKK